MNRTTNLLPLATRILFGLTVLFCLAGAARGGGIIAVTSNADSGLGTLRDAIEQSNASPGFLDTIVFTGVTTIALATPLPAITDPVIIDGGATPTVELNGLGTQGAGIGSIGLWIRAGSTTVRGMIINRFGEAGIRMDTDGAGDDNSNSILGNRIGTDAAGNSAVCGANPCGNINRGILIVGTTSHSIGNGTIAGRNLISANQGRGIEISAGGAANINNNFIGTDAAGTADLGNTSHGILIVNSNASSIDTNTISGNNGNGVAILQDFGFTASFNVVQGNYIGVDASGNTALPNNGSGVVLQAAGNTVGGVIAAGRNIISGNSANGVSIGTNFATGNIVRGNYIGVGANGTTSIPNTDNGVQISNNAAGNTIGGTTGITPGACTGECNIIANNGSATSLSSRAGIYLDITAGAGNALRANSIFNNTGLGIDLGATGATANDTGDPDTGANNQQNKPVITTANTSEFISGTLNSTPLTTFVIDFFINMTPPDTAATSEGRTYIGSTNASTDASGNATFNFSSTVVLNFGQFVTATATATGTAPPFAPQAVGDSSEHSDPFAVTFVVTAANVSLSGRVMSGKRGISRAYIYLTGSGGETFVTQTNSFGYYRFDAVGVGVTYVISVRHKSYQFTPQVITVTEDLENVDFAPNP